MNWEAIAAIGEDVGAFGVIVSLGYLAIQIRQNTRRTHRRGGFRGIDNLFAARDRTLDPRVASR
jgi:hypothetical protein